MCASLRRHSMPARLPTQLRRTSKATPRLPITPRRQLGGPTLLSYCPLQPRLSSACRTSSPSSRVALTSLLNRPARHPAHRHQSCTSLVSCLRSTPRALSASSSSTRRSSSSRSTGHGWWPSSPLDRSGSSRATSGRIRQSFSDTRWGSTLAGGEITYRTRCAAGVEAS
jgi:hypothetical protein